MFFLQCFNIADLKTKTRLNIHKTVDILLLPTSDKKAVVLNDSKLQSASENTDIPSSEENNTKHTRKLKNIQKALEIINNNRSDDNLAVLNMGLECIKASALVNIDKTLVDTKEPIHIEQSSRESNIEIEEISIKVVNNEFDRRNNEMESNSIKRGRQVS